MKTDSSPQSQGSEIIEDSVTTKEDEDAKLPRKSTRRRTKTGCITCRKRRIKCGEERPICSNCIKSRRQCEGYRPPIVFRRSVLDNGNYMHSHGLLPIQSSSIHRGSNQYLTQNSLGQRLPRFSNEPTGISNEIHSAPSNGLISSASATYLPRRNELPSVSSSHSSSFHPHSSDPPNPTLPLHEAGVYHRYFPRPENGKQVIQRPAMYHLMQNINSSAVQTSADLLIRSGESLFELGGHSATNHDSNFLPGRDIEQQTSQPDSPIKHPAANHLKSTSTVLYRLPVIEHGMGAQQILEDSAVEVGERSLAKAGASTHSSKAGTQSSLMMSNGSQLPFHKFQSSFPTEQEAIFRSSISNAGSIGLYRAEQAASPLNNANTARVFNYYRIVTAPLICPWSRNPEMSAEMLHKLTVPILTKNFFIYTVPLLALQDHGLLHALLALTSLHMAKSFGISTTPALKHYSWSLKRVHHSVRNQSTRLNISTLAATLYLSMYEIMTADHGKWNTHLNGAGQLMKELNFAELTSSIYTLKHSQKPFRTKSTAEKCSVGWSDTMESILDDADLEQINEVDHEFIRCISGINAVPLYHTVHAAQRPKFSVQDVQFYPVLQDIFWWFVKMDLIRAIVGGGPLMLGFQRTLEIPPRTTFHGQVHGASDHLHILLARLVDFTSRDRARKVKTAEGQQNSLPRIQFYGLAPYTEQDRMPSAFHPNESETTLPATSIPEPLETDLPSATVRAMKEWNEINKSFMLLESRLSSYYSPLSAQDFLPTTPFGQAVIFQSYQIGCLWATYYMACIFLHRVHPTMPPQHTLAVGMAAERTATFANLVGRIVAGMRLDQSETTYRPATSAAFAECSMPIFVAGVQYQDNEQRRFTVARLQEIERLTGRASVGLQAKGCEVVWQRAHAAGYGPPYEKASTAT